MKVQLIKLLQHVWLVLAALFEMYTMYTLQLLSGSESIDNLQTDPPHVSSDLSSPSSMTIYVQLKVKIANKLVKYE